jgi:hypothetical protein
MKLMDKSQFAMIVLTEKIVVVVVARIVAVAVAVVQFVM